MKATVSSFAVVAVLLAGCSSFSPTSGVRRLSLADYRDRMAGAWLGQSVGVAYGWPTEFRYNGKTIPDEKLPTWSPELVNETFSQDDLYVEMTFLRTLETRGLDVSCRAAGIDFANSRYRLWCANDRARNNLRRGVAAPASAHPDNHSSTDDIDFQIESDFTGILSPGMPSRVLTLCGQFGRIMNRGDGLYAGAFVGALYAAAYFETDRVKTVERALEAIPSESGYAEMVRDLLAWYRENPGDWRSAWRKAVDKYRAKENLGRVSNPDISVRVNGAMVLLGYLFGEGDVERTMRIATAGGFDSDCNPSSALGVLGVQLGAKAFGERYVGKLDMARKWEYTDYTYPKLLEVCERLTREIVVAEGGRIVTEGGVEYFEIPEREVTDARCALDDPGSPSDRYTEAEMNEIRYLPTEKSGVESKEK